MSPPTVLGALFAILAGDGGVNALLNGAFWLSEAPPEAPLPYLVVEHRGERPTFTSEAASLAETSLRLTALASRDPSQPAVNPVHPAEFAEKIMAAVKLAILDKPLDVAGAQSVRLRWGSYGLALDRTLSPEGERVYRATLDVTATIEWQRVLPG